MRFAHIIKHNKTSESPQRVMAIALNDYPDKGRGVTTTYAFDYGAGCLAIRSRGETNWRYQWFEFTSKEQFWRLVERMVVPKTKTICFVENSKKTLPLLDAFTSTYKRGWTCTLAVIESPPLIVRWQTGHGTFVCLDKQNLWQQPLINYSRGKRMPSCDVSLDDTDYAKRVQTVKLNAQSMLSLAVEWMNFLHTNDLGTFASTMAGQSMKVFRHRYMTHQILIDTNADALKLARAAYVGARTECWYVGKKTGKFYLVDVNSMYASVMKEMYVPIRLRGFSTHVKISDIALWTSHDCMVADVDLDTDEPAYALRHEFKLTFPIGQFRTYLAGDEVLYALEHGHIKHVYAVAVYDTAQAFKDFVIAMWNRRAGALACGDQAEAYKYKLILASFYGKWGQHGGTWEKIGEAQNAEIKTWAQINHHTKEVTLFRQFGGIIQQRGNDAESFESAPAIAACITANARMKLWSLMKTAGLENVYYVDTDSLLVNETGFTHLQPCMYADALGGLRCVGVYRDITIYASKDYQFDARRRTKGISGQATIVADGVFEQNEFASIGGMVRCGSMSEASSRTVRRSLRRSYDKGTVLEDGTVKPLMMKANA